MTGTIDTMLEKRREQRALDVGRKPEEAKGKETPDRSGPTADDASNEERIDELDGRGRD